MDEGGDLGGGESRGRRRRWRKGRRLGKEGGGEDRSLTGAHAPERRPVPRRMRVTFFGFCLRVYCE